MRTLQRPAVQPPQAPPTTADRIRCLPCTSCWQLTGRPCADGADHLRRYLDAEGAGLISQAALVSALAALDVIACAVLVPEVTP